PGRARSERAHDQGSVGREAQEAGKSLRAGPQDSRNQERLRASRRDLGNTTSRASGRLAVVDGDLTNPRHDTQATGISARAGCFEEINRFYFFSSVFSCRLM